MTIEEFYNWAKAKGIEHFELVVHKGQDPFGKSILSEPNLVEDREERRVIV